jgi:hypothetical protein
MLAAPVQHFLSLHKAGMTHHPGAAGTNATVLLGAGPAHWHQTQFVSSLILHKQQARLTTQANHAHAHRNVLPAGC